MANEKTTQILEEIKTLTILELADLVRHSRRSSVYPLLL